MIEIIIKNVELRVDGAIHPIRTREEIHQCIDYLNRLLLWLDKAETAIPQIGSFGLATTDRRASELTEEEAPADGAKSETIFYVLSALELKGHPVRIQELVPLALRAGWVTKSDTLRKQARSLEASARRNRELVMIQSGIARLTTKGQEYLKQARSRATKEGVADEPSDNENDDYGSSGKDQYPVGSRAIDAAVIALGESGGGASLDDIVSKSWLYGWDVRHVASPRLSVYGKAKKYPGLVHIDGSELSLTDDGWALYRRIRGDNQSEQPAE